MSINGPHIRSEHRRSLDRTVPSGGCIAGAMVKVGDTVGVYAETKDAGDVVALIYQADAILLPKKAASAGEQIAIGAKVYFEAASAKITGTSGSNTLCGRCLEAALSADTEVLCDLSGNVAA